MDKLDFVLLLITLFTASVMAFGVQLLILLSTSVFTSGAIQSHRSLATTKTASGLYPYTRPRGISVGHPETLAETPTTRPKPHGLLTPRVKLDSSRLTARRITEKICNIVLSRDQTTEPSWRPSIQRRAEEKTNGESQRDMSRGRNVHR